MRGDDYDILTGHLHLGSSLDKVEIMCNRFRDDGIEMAIVTFDAAGQRLIDGRLLNVVLVLMLTTSILGPVLPERLRLASSQI